MGLRDRLFKKQDESTASQNSNDETGGSHDVFISYSTKDSTIANKVCYALEENGLKCWIAPRNITSGSIYAEEISSAVKDSKIVVLILSQFSDESKYVQNEIQMAFEWDKPIIPFKIDESMPSEKMYHMLVNTQWLDAYPSPEEKFETLVRDALNLIDGPDNDKSGKDIIRYEYDVNISYSSKDKHIADAVCHVLEHNGLKCWIAPRNIRTGKSYASEIVEGIKSSKMLVLIFSKNSMESVYVQHEIELAFNYNKEILSFKIDDTLPEGKMEYLLKSKHWLDAYPSPEREFEKLFEDVSLLISQSGKETSSENPRSGLEVKNNTNQDDAQVYISYDGNDSDVAGEVCNFLEDKNIFCWLKERHIKSEDIINAADDAIKNSKLLILIFSKDSKKSNHVNTEVDIAFSYNIPIFVLRIDESNLGGGLEFFITNKHWIDATSNMKKAMKRLYNDVLKVIPHTQQSYISFSTPSDIVRAGEVIALSGTLNGDSEQIHAGNVKIYMNGGFVDTVVSSASGRFYALIPGDDAGSYEFRAVFEGNDKYDSCESEIVSVEVVNEITHEQSQDNVKRPFKAYQGDKPYIFISYAHKDAHLVFPEIKIFHDEGYPIWYDQGLTPGQEWDDEVANALINCTLLVVFISKNSMDSNNVQDEIKLALNRNINIVPIYFEATVLPPGLELRLSNKHAIMKYMMNHDDYVLECFKAFNEYIPKAD